MMAQQIIKHISERSDFITPMELGETFKIPYEKAFEFLEMGVDYGIFFQALKHAVHDNYSRYGVKEKVLLNLQGEEIRQFNKIVERYFNEFKEIKQLDLELSELREKVLTAIASKKRNRATELLVIKIEDKNFIYTTKDDKSSEMWVYKEGIYVPQGKSYVKEFCRHILGHAYTPQLANEVIAKIEADTFIEQARHDEVDKIRIKYNELKQERFK